MEKSWWLMEGEKLPRKGENVKQFVNYERAIRLRHALCVHVEDTY